MRIYVTGASGFVGSNLVHVFADRHDAEVIAPGHDHVDLTDAVMVRRYAQARALAMAYSIETPAVAHAIARLAYFTAIVDEPKLRRYVTSTPDPADPSKTLAYSEGMFLQRPVVVAPPIFFGDTLPFAP